MRVTWTEAALDALADVYVTLSLAEQDEVGRAVARINTELALAGETAGESREGNARVYFDGRLMVLYLVRAATNTALVYEIRRQRGPKY